MPKRTGWIFLVAGAALLAGLFVLFKPAGPPPPDASAPAEAEPGGTAPGVAGAVRGARIVELRLREGRLESGPAVTQVAQGDEVLLRVITDRVDDLHVHGYDLELSVHPGIVGELRFVADRSGRFEYELHHAHVELGVLEVQPK